VPQEPGEFVVDRLLHLLDSTLLDLIVTEPLEVVGEAQHPNAPLDGIVLILFNCIPVVEREFVMKVVVALAKCDQGGDDVVSGRVSVVERRSPSQWARELTQKVVCWRKKVRTMPT
jgi:hypothetical protein